MASLSATLGLLLLLQVPAPGQVSGAALAGPAYFEFLPITSPVIAGDSFGITIIARDSGGNSYPYTGTALLITTRGSYVSPNIVQFANGTVTRKVIVTLADSMRLRCFTDSASGLSNSFAVVPDSARRLLVLLPGEDLAPGVAGGRSGRAFSRTAGDTFDFRVALTDNWFNPVTRTGDSVFFSCTDRFASLPPSDTLSAGLSAFRAGLRAAGLHRIVARPAPGSGLRPDTSSGLNVVPGPFDRMLMVVPGETLLPGDNATGVWDTPGKSGRPLPQFLRTPFNVTVVGTDRCWNPVPGPGENVALASDFNIQFAPIAAPLGDSASFSVQFREPGAGQNLWAYGTLSGRQTYRTVFDIRSLGATMRITKPDTVVAGETAYIRVDLRDVNLRPVKQAVVRFAVYRGNGNITEPALLTDTVGVVTAEFVCTAARFAEHDSIRIWSGNADTTIGIYVDIPDSAIMQGRIVAFPNPFGFNRDACEITYYLTQSSPLRVMIHDAFGNEVVSWRLRQGEAGARVGVNRIYWNGFNKQGRRVANGVYVLTILGEIHTGTTFNETYRIGVLW